MKPTVHASSAVGVLLEAPRRRMLPLIAAAIFLPALAIGIAAGYRVAPSVVVALAVTYVAQMLCLTAAALRYGAEGTPGLHAGGKALDRWLGLDVGDLGTVTPGSFEAAMHSELGALPAARAVPIANPAAAGAGGKADMPAWQAAPDAVPAIAADPLSPK